MSDFNIILFMEESLNLNKFNNVLMQFHANDQKSCWVIEKNDGCIWVNYYTLKENRQIKEIWESIKPIFKEGIQIENIESAVFVQPSRDGNAVFLSLSFCQEIYSCIDQNKHTVLYHERSGIFVDMQIKRLKFENTRKFYDSNLINSQIISNIVMSLYSEFLSGIECIEEEGGWDGQELQYIDIYKNMFIMRDDLDDLSSKMLIDAAVENRLKEIDNLIVKLFLIDTEQILIRAGEEQKSKEMRKWWWHLDKIKSGELIADIDLKI